MTCFGCKHISSKWYGDGTTIYGCKLCPGLCTGEHSAFSDEDDEPKRCDKYEPANTQCIGPSGAGPSGR